MQKRHMVHVTVSLLLIHDDQLLMLRRRSKFANGFYSVIAGCIDPDESATQAIIREAQEEANILIKPEWLRLGSVGYNTMNERGPTHEAVDFFFVSHKWENEIVNQEPDKHFDLAFYPLKNLPDPIIPFVKKGIEASLNGIPLVEYGWSKDLAKSA